ncbi:MAG: carboxypeptidase regulatory-like domain-containing protein [Candidatus Sericytochromatia bacterium]|nr:carboxypeptidase regulatory-like domain-containing protein [Candidatus Sericytochromatia bacterium]
MRRITFAGWLLGAGMALSMACSADQLKTIVGVIQPAQVNGKGVVSGRVVDQTTQKPVAEARVTVGTAKAVTTAEGAYAVSGLVPGTLFLKVETNGYQSFFGEVKVTDGTTHFDIPLKPLGSSPTASPASPSSPLSPVTGPGGPSSPTPAPMGGPSDATGSASVAIPAHSPSVGGGK